MKPILFPKLAAAAVVVACCFFFNQIEAQAQPTDKKVSVAKKDDRPSPPAKASAVVGDLKLTIN